MSNIVPIEKREQALEVASLWIAKIDRDLTSAERNELKLWLAQSNLHREILFEMAGLWDRMDCLSRLSELFPDHKAEAENNKHKKSHVNAYLAIAASIFFGFVSISFGALMFSQAELPSGVMAALGVSKFEAGVYETGVGEYSTVTLPDGSELVLNTDTLARVKYLDDARLFYLQRGEIHIEVAHDKSRPLSVIAGDKVVQAVGTAFNVQRVGERQIELIVTDGKVLVADSQIDAATEDFKPVAMPEGSLSVSKGEKIIFGAGNAKVDKIDSNDMEASLSWRQGNIVFRGETLEEALVEVSRYTDVEFIITDESIKGLRIAGMFKAGDINGLIIALRETFNIEAHKVDKKSVSLSSI